MDATATLLRSGKVLIAGGAVTDDVIQTGVASAELYDPATDKFTPTGSMTGVRYAATAILLQDGRVLIVGGYGCVMNACDPSTYSSAELYDPTVGKFTRVGLPKGFIVASATGLLDGDVLLIGGGDGKVAETAKLFNPATGRFVRTGDSLVDMSFGKDTTTLLPDGRVLMTGESADGPVAQIYDPTSGKFTSIPFAPPKGPAASAQYEGKPVNRTAPDTATLLSDGRVLFFEKGYLETYDVARGAFAPAGFMYSPGQWVDPKATLLADGRVLFDGGDFFPIQGGDDEVCAIESALFTPTEGPRIVGPLATPRCQQMATLLPDGSVCEELARRGALSGFDAGRVRGFPRFDRGEAGLDIADLIGAGEDHRSRERIDFEVEGLWGTLAAG